MRHAIRSGLPETFMTPLLRPGLHYRCVNESFVFFDLLENRYFLLAGSSAEAFQRFLNGTSTQADHDELQSCGLTGETGKGRVPRAVSIASPSRSLVDAPLRRSDILSAVASVAAQRRAQRDLRRRPIAQILGEFSGAHDSIPAATGEACEAIAAAFHRARRYVSIADQCLPRGIAMKRMMARQKQGVSLVFGVTMPFAAHCWVQAGDLVLTDPLDVVLHYEPIFAV
ncbi:MULTISPECIES: lasso peptide biosynthesis B2 protein [unclassified Sphingopyxis]|uniref:lasso peptide biosynthesis B2 protein n=2 Tax=Sphingopyxis TaxID=165697 RepID=UPI00073B144C|nr:MULTISPECIES: lasso peptide biosynthesis B2 protein [unclassified Sphingopyxis]KTE47471.1 hypothetical protein ATE73_07675 [Sphingopyxis sp. H077]KTE61256.1 hypothetical protein ATE74_21350 [Sphingopyxis sp. H085]